MYYSRPNVACVESPVCDGIVDRGARRILAGGKKKNMKIIKTLYCRRIPPTYLPVGVIIAVGGVSGATSGPRRPPGARRIKEIRGSVLLKSLGGKKKRYIVLLSTRFIIRYSRLI